MRLQAAKVDLLSRCPHQTAAVSSLLFDPSSRSLALMLSDTSALLFPSFSASPTRRPPPPPTVVPPINTAACFLRLLPSAHVLFLSASPLASGASVQLRAWIVQSIPRFAPAKLSFRKQLRRSAVALDLPHGLSLRIASSVNVFVIHSLVARQIWVLAAKPEGDTKDVVINLVKCAVVELTLPVYSVAMSNGFLLLGEVNGVRVFPLRRLIKGQKSKKGGAFGPRKASSAVPDDDLRRKKLPNGIVIRNAHDKINWTASESDGFCDSKGCRPEDADENAERCPYKLKTTRLRQASCDHFSLFVMIEGVEVHNSGSDARPLTPLQVISIHLLSQKKILILDSTGYLHVLTLPSMAASSEMNTHFSMILEDAHLHHLDHTMRVEMLATLPDVSSKTQFIWISDGGHSIHIMPVADIESPASEIDKDESMQKAIAADAIFTSGKIMEIIPLSVDSILVHCQGGIYTYVVA